MGALSTKVDATAVTEAIPSEILPQWAYDYEYAPRVGVMIAAVEPGAGSIAHRFLRWEQLDGGSGVPSGTKTETDTFTDVTLTLAESSITPGLFGFRLPLSDEARKQVVLGSWPRGLVEAGLDGLMDRVDSDTLSSSTSATQITGADTDTFTAGKFRAATFAYRMLKVPSSPMGHAFVGSLDAFRDLQESHGSSSSPYEANEASEKMFGPVSGYKGRYGGFEIFESANVATTGSGYSNFMTPIGRRASGLGIVMVESPNVETTRGDDAASRAVTYMVTRAWGGFGITTPNRILEVLGRT